MKAEELLPFWEYVYSRTLTGNDLRDGWRMFPLKCGSRSKVVLENHDGTVSLTLDYRNRVFYTTAYVLLQVEHDAPPLELLYLCPHINILCQFITQFLRRKGDHELWEQSIDATHKFFDMHHADS